MDADFNARNATARARLEALVGRLTARDLDRPLGEGWTVKAALGHLAFWDRLAVAAVETWRRTGATRLDGNVDPFINGAGLGDWLAASPEHALREVLRAAESADRTAAAIDEALHADILTHEEGWVCERSPHRVEHIEQIERAVGRPLA